MVSSLFSGAFCVMDFVLLAFIACVMIAFLATKLASSVLLTQFILLFILLQTLLRVTFFDFNKCECVIAGDFNTAMDSNDVVALRVNDFVNSCFLVRCDDLFPSQKVNTYVNLSLGQCSHIDYILVSNVNDVTRFTVLDPDVNFSDHLPLFAELSVSYSTRLDQGVRLEGKARIFKQPQLRWDKADSRSYCSYTGDYLQPMGAFLENLTKEFQVGGVTTEDVHCYIESTYRSIVSVLYSAANVFVPKCRKGFFKFWWDEGLNLLKEASVESNRIWKAAGKPRQGPIFTRREECRLQYRKRLRESQKMDTEAYTNDLHEALMRKNNTYFWNCWKSKFEVKSKCSQVDGCVDRNVIADKFANHFKDTFSCNDPIKAKSIKVITLLYVQVTMVCPLLKPNILTLNLSVRL